MPFSNDGRDAERDASQLAHHSADDVNPDATQPAAPDESLDCRALIDESLKPKDWRKLFRRLLNDDTTLSAALLLKYRFGLPAPHLSLRRPQGVPIHIGLPERENEMESAPRTTDEISPQRGG